MAEQQKEKTKTNFEPSPQDIQAFARSLFPIIKAYYDSEDGQKEFAEWKARYAQEKSTEKS